MTSYQKVSILRGQLMLAVGVLSGKLEPDDCSMADIQAVLEQTKGPQYEEAENGKWRVGHKLGRTIYYNDSVVGIVDSPELAEFLVRAANNSDSYHSKL